MNIKVDFDNIVVKEDKNDFNVKVLMLKGEKGDQGDGEPNVIEKVQVNGSDLPVTNKAVNVQVPTNVSSLANDSGYLVENDLAMIKTINIENGSQITDATGYGRVNKIIGDASQSAIPTPSSPIDVNVVTGDITITITDSSSTSSNSHTISLGTLELCGIGNYKDYIYKDNGYWYKYGVIAKKVLNGSESYNFLERTGVNVFANNGTYASTIYKSASNKNIISDCFKSVKDADGNVANSIRSNNSGQVFIAIPNTESIAQSVSAFTNWLASNNVTTYYILATPVITQITDASLITQLDEIRNIVLNNGINNFIMTSNDLTPTLNISYAITDRDIYSKEEVNDLIENLNDKEINKKVYYFDSVADMKAYNLKDGDYAITKGYYEANDGGGGNYSVTNIQKDSEYQEELNNGLYCDLIQKNKKNRLKFKDTTGTMQAGIKRDIASQVGMKWARMSFVWESCEIEKGVIDQTALQGFVDNFLEYKQLGINTLALLCYNNTNYVDDVYDAIETTENLEGFVNFCSAVANKLKGNNVVYLIWNEPNGNFWKSNNKEYYYVNMIKEVSKAIKEVDSTALIAGPEQGGINYYSTSQDTSISSSTFFENCCKEGLLDYVDYISYHAYYGEESEKIIDAKNSSNIFLTKGIASKYSVRDIPIIITEFGGSTYTGGITEEEQARGIVKSYILNNAYDVKISSQYSFLNTGSDTNEKEDNFGMAYINGTLKPSGEAVSFLLSLIGDYYFNRVEKMDFYDDYCFVYDNGEANSKEIYCLWTTNDAHTIALKDNLVNCNLYDMFGVENTTGTTLLLTKNPQYIEVLNPSETHYATKEDVEKIATKIVQENNFKNTLLNNNSDIGVNNILKNSDFSFGKKYITDWEGTSEVVVDANLNEKVLKITSTGQGAYFNNAYDCKVGDILTWSCWVKTDTFCNIAVGCEAGETWASSNYNTERTGILRCDVYPDEWKKISKTFVVSRANYNNFVLYTQDASSQDPIELLIYHPQIVKAPKIKDDYTPKTLDYEYGTFTPKLENPAQTSEANYTSREGHYYKIGNLVYFDIYMVISNNNSLIGTCLVAGLPYAPKYRNGISIGEVSGLNIAPYTQLIAHTYPNSKRMNIKKVDNTGGATDLTFGNVSNNSVITLSGVYYTE